MNYQNQYNKIISNAQQEDRKRCKVIYYEKHHIIPTCLNGSNDNNNKVLLTAKEHFICHKLLTYLYPHHPGIALAFHMLAFDKNTNRNVSVRDYEYARELCKEALTGKNNGNYGAKLSKEHLDKMLNGRLKANEEKRLLHKDDIKIFKCSQCKINIVNSKDLVCNECKELNRNKRNLIPKRIPKCKRCGGITHKRYLLCNECKQKANKVNKEIQKSYWTEEVKKQQREVANIYWTKERRLIESLAQREAQKSYPNQLF